jgi:hypothetical protein
MRRTQWKLYQDKICATGWELFGDSFRQAWNTGTLYERKNKARGFVTSTQLSGFTQPVHSPISNPYYLLDRVHAVPQEYVRRQWYLPSRSTLPATVRGHVWSIQLSRYTRDLARAVVKIGRFGFKTAINLSWHFALYLKPLIISMFFIAVVCKYPPFFLTGLSE